MSASATFLARAAERVPCWSPTSHAGARPDRRPALLSSRRAIVMGAQATPIGPTSRRNHPTATSARLAPTPIAAVKSP